MSSTAGSSNDRVRGDPLRELIATESCLQEILSRARADADEIVRAAQEEAAAMDEALTAELGQGRNERAALSEAALSLAIATIEEEWRSRVLATECALAARAESLADLVAATALGSAHSEASP
jgi:hypothetical protein